MLWLRELCSFMSKEQSRERRDFNSDSLYRTPFSCYATFTLHLHFSPLHLNIVILKQWTQIWDEVSDSLSVRTSQRSTVWLTGDSNVTAGLPLIYHIHHFLWACDKALRAALCERKTCNHSLVLWRKQMSIYTYIHMHQQTYCICIFHTRRSKLQPEAC